MNGETRAAVRCGGFTLVELLVALTILALMLGVTMNSLSFSLRTSGSVETAIADKEYTYLATRAFRDQLQQAVPLLRVSTAGLNELDFDGASNAVEFVAPLRGAHSSAGLHRVRFVIEQEPSFEDNRGRLVMHYRPYSADTTKANVTDNVAESSVVVLDGFASARFSFSDVATSVAVDWTPQWRETMRLPDLVRLEVDYANDDDQVMIPEAVVAIRTTSQNRLLRGEAR
jgi:general secretion pathway protein J